MSIPQLEPRDTSSVKNLDKATTKLLTLISELNRRPLPEDVEAKISERVSQLNAIKNTDKRYKKELQKHTWGILSLLKQELNLTARNANRNSWMALGMTIFGLPLGLVLGLLLDNLAFMGAFLPIGMVIGMAIGANKDKEALKEGRQLPIEG